MSTQISNFSQPLFLFNSPRQRILLNRMCGGVIFCSGFTNPFAIISPVSCKLCKEKESYIPLSLLIHFHVCVSLLLLVISVDYGSAEHWFHYWRDTENAKIAAQFQRNYAHKKLLLSPKFSGLRGSNTCVIKNWD